MINSRKLSQAALEEAKKALHRKEHRTARRWAEKAASLAPDNEEPWLFLAAVASPRASLAYLQRALIINPDSSNARRGMRWAVKRWRQKTPKIAPVLDLSAVTRGANELPSIFARPRLAVAPSSLDDSYSEGPTGVSKPGSQEQAGVQFTQNNYSPKALSQVEIYRQTQNQISTFKRKVAA